MKSTRLRARQPHHVLCCAVPCEVSASGMSPLVAFRRFIEHLQGFPVYSAAAMTGLPPQRQVTRTTRLRPYSETGRAVHNVDYYRLSRPTTATMVIPVSRPGPRPVYFAGAPLGMMVTRSSPSCLLSDHIIICRRIKRAVCRIRSVHVVGVLKDVKQGRRRDGTALYIPRQRDQRVHAVSLNIVIRSTLMARSPRVRERHAADPSLPICNMRRWRGSRSRFAPRFLAQLLTICGALALILDATDLRDSLLAVTSAVRDRLLWRWAPDRGRSSDGARSGMRVTAIGLVVGIAVAAVTRSVAAAGRGEATDPLPFASVALFISVIAVFACPSPPAALRGVDPWLCCGPMILTARAE